MESVNHIILEEKKDVAHIIFDFPPTNVITAEVMRQLSQTFEYIASKNSFKAIVFRSDGEVFSVGSEIGESRPEVASEMMVLYDRLFTQIEECQIPILSLVKGAAIGRGFELVLMSDIVIASNEATFSSQELSFGLMSPVCIAYLPRVVGQGQAIEVISTSRLYRAAEMYRMGVVSYLLPVHLVELELLAILDEISQSSPLILRINLKYLKRSNKQTRKLRRDAQKAFLDELMKTEDVLEGIASFYQKRPVLWKNR